MSVVHIFVFAPRRAVSAPVAQTATPDCRRLDRAAVDNGRRFHAIIAVTYLEKHRRRGCYTPESYRAGRSLAEQLVGNLRQIGL
ncbi:MAG: hypothetical protein WA838_07880, partial [Xanthobacteraceae bacterium]